MIAALCTGLAVPDAMCLVDGSCLIGRVGQAGVAQGRGSGGKEGSGAGSANLLT